MKKTALLAFLLTTAATAALAEVNPNRPADPQTQAEAAQTFIVTFKPQFTGDPGARAQALAAANDAALKFVYGSALKGFAARMSDAAAAALLRNNPEIQSVERDAVVTSEQATEVTPPGVARIGAADGVTSVPGRVWVIDTGVDLTHPDLNIERVNAKSFVKGSNNANDQNGHGTHVAGIVAARKNGAGVVGVAPGAAVVPVQVLSKSGSGAWSQVIAGVDYVKSKHDACAPNGGCAPEYWVANTSVGGPKSDALNTAVRNAANAGVRFAIAAGNESSDANNYSPASAATPPAGGNKNPNIFVVSASCWNAAGCTNDGIASFSNYANPPVAFAAPGVNIYSTYKGGAYATLSGTSMAAPHVAGVLIRAPWLLATDTTQHYNGCLKADRDATLDRIAFAVNITDAQKTYGVCPAY